MTRIEKCKQSNLQEIKALKRVLFFSFFPQRSKGVFFVSFDSDGEAPRDPNQPMTVLTEPTDLQTCNILASLEDRASKVMQMPRLRARSGTKYVSKYSVTLNISRESPLTQSFPALSRSQGIGLVSQSINSFDYNDDGLVSGSETLQLDAQDLRSDNDFFMCNRSLETFSYPSYPYFCCSLRVFR